MAKFKIETLSPVHVGSGNLLQQNTEFLYDGNRIGIVDEIKVLNIIGHENIDKWVTIINKGEKLWDYLKTRKHDLKLEDVSKRILDVYGENTSRRRDLREQMHNGTGSVCLPGSSIKGAIRTALLSRIVDANIDKIFISEIESEQGNKRKWQNEIKYSSQNIEKRFFGNVAKKDVFRFLQVGDAHFYNNTIAVNMKTLNKTYNGWDWKDTVTQLTESIPTACNTSFTMKINKELLEKNIDKRLVKKISQLNDFDSLFSSINVHTLYLLNEETEFWEEEDREIEAIEDYVDKLNTLKQITNSCSKNEAVIRIGFGSGWKFITGNIADEIYSGDDDKWFFLVSKLGRKDCYFPKTRKIDNDGDMLGFVKISMI